MFRFYDFFAGAGLAGLGLGPFWECAWANDIDPKKAAVYEANFDEPGKEKRFLLEDVNRVSAHSLPSPVEMAWASFPCQDLSLAGWRRGMSAERSGTFWAFWRIMRDLLDERKRPPVIVLENVTGMLYGRDFAGLCEALAALGMQFGALVVDARWFLPQSRPRVFVVAVDLRIDCGMFEEVLPGESPWFPKAVWAAHASLPGPLKDLWRWWKLPVPTERPPAIEAIIEEDPIGVAWHSEEETNRLLDMMNPLNRRKVTDALARGGRSVGFLYKRTRGGKQRAEVRFDGIAGCLRTPQGGSSRQTVLIVENGSVRSRLLSPREAARLMGAPDSFRLPEKYNDAYKAMGDAVAVPVVAWLEEHLLRPLASLNIKDAVNGSYDPEFDDKMNSSREATELLAAQWGGVRS